MLFSLISSRKPSTYTMNHKIYTVFVLILCNFTLFAQKAALSGKITDQNGKPIPFATIYIKNTNLGTSANSEGYYNLQVPFGKYEIVYRGIGYKQETRNAEIKNDLNLNIALQAEIYALKAVNISSSGEDPAYAIIRKTIKRRNYFLHQVNAYNCKVYIKGLQKLLAAPKKFMGRDINKIARENGLDSNRTGIVYLSESESKLTYMQPDKIHEEMLSSKVSGNNRGFSFNRASDVSVNFYRNYEQWQGLSNRPLISPIADNAFLYYRYKLLGTTIENGETISKIQVIPRRDYDPVFEGNIYIVENSWRLYSVNLFITKKANINFVDTLTVNQQFFPVKPNIWLTSSVQFNFTAGFLGFKIGGYYISVYKDYDLDPPVNKKDFAELIHIEKGINKKDSDYWQRERPIPLTIEEKTDYTKKEILARKRESKPYLDSLDRVNNHFKLGKLLLLGGYDYSNRYQKMYFHFGPVLGSMLYNTVEGFALNYNASYVKQIDSNTNKYLRLNGRVRYGFSNSALHGSLSGVIPIHQTTLGFDVGSDVVDLNNQTPFRSGINTIYSLFRKKNREKFYDKQFAGLTLSRRITGGWLISVGTEAAYRQSLNNTSAFSFYQKADRKFTSNNPLRPDIDTPLFVSNHSFKIGLRTTYNFSNQYETYPNGRRYLPSKYPTIGFSYTKGIKNIFSSDVDYDLISADVEKNDIDLGIYGKSSFYVKAGKFTNNNSLFYPDYQHFLGNEEFIYNTAINSFMLLRYYTYSTPNEYLEGHFEHNFYGFLINKLPLIRKLKLQEIVKYNYLATPQLNNYQELGVGFQYLGIRAMYGWSYHTGLNIQSGFRLGVLIAPGRQGR
jgi:hypothetical protein